MIFIDTETSGLDCYKHQILTIGLVITDNNFKILFEKEYKIKQNKFSIIDEEALKINDINIEEHNKIAVPEWTNCMNLAYDIFKFTKKFSWNIPIGHNVIFDLTFIRVLFERNKVFNPFHYQYIDTLVLANIVNQLELLPTKNLKLETISKYFGNKAKLVGEQKLSNTLKIFKNKNFQYHNALEDTKATVFIYQKMLEVMRKNEM